jgi:hypothetical protein
MPAGRHLLVVIPERRIQLPRVLEDESPHELNEALGVLALKIGWKMQLGHLP